MDYGYKVCSKIKYKKYCRVRIVTNSYESAEWHRRRYELRSPPNVTWLVIPIATRREYLRRWKDCPF